MYCIVSFILLGLSSLLPSARCVSLLHNCAKWQRRVKEETKEKAASVTPHSIWCFTLHSKQRREGKKKKEEEEEEGEEEDESKFSEAKGKNKCNRVEGHQEV